MLEALDRVAGEAGATPAQVAIAWLLARPGVASALASATRPEQVAEVMPAAGLQLTAAQVAALDRVTDGL